MVRSAIFKNMRRSPMATWRQYLAPLVEAVILEVGTDDMPKLRKAFL